MKITYDPEVDALAITLKDVEVVHTEELQEGILADYDADENIVGLEILDASERVDRADGVDFRLLRDPATV